MINALIARICAGENLKTSEIEQVFDSFMMSAMTSRSEIRPAGWMLRSFLWLGMAIASAGLAAADEPKGPAANDNEPLATVDNVTIRRAAVKRILTDKLPNLAPKKAAEAEAAALETIVRQRLALARLVAKKQAASDADVEHEISVIKERLKPLGITLEAHLKELNMDALVNAAGFAPK